MYWVQFLTQMLAVRIHAVRHEYKRHFCGSLGGLEESANIHLRDHNGRTPFQEKLNRTLSMDGMG